MSSIYTIFGRFFGYLEKSDVILKRLKHTTGAVSDQLHKQSQEMVHAGDKLKNLVEARDKEIKAMEKYEKELMRYQTLKEAGVTLNTKEQASVRKNINMLNKATLASEEYNKQIKEQEKRLGAAEEAAYGKGSSVLAARDSMEEFDQIMIDASKHLENHRSLMDRNVAMGQSLSDVLGTNVPLAMGQTINKGIKLMATLNMLESLQEQGGAAKLYGEQMESSFSVLTNGKGIKEVLAKFSKLKGLLGPIAAAIAAIGSLLKSFKMIWEENVGNIQGEFIATMGTISNAMARVGAYMRRFFRSMGKSKILQNMIAEIGKAVRNLVPLFELLAKVIGTTIGGTAMAILYTFATVLSGIAKVINTIVEGIKYVGRFLGMNSNSINEEGIQRNSVSNRANSIRGTGSRYQNTYNNQPNINIYTDDPTKGNEAAKVWDRVTGTFQRDSMRNGENGNY